VDRAKVVTVRALDESGNEIEFQGAELLARCLQHEIDHLHGKLFLDYLSVLKRRSALAKWETVKGDYPTFIRKVKLEKKGAHHSEGEL
jgi:peptide deformylase